MAKKMTLTAALSLAGTVILSLLYRNTQQEALLSLAITFGTISYHVGMRNKAEYRRRWYRVGEREMAVYEALHVKKWKAKMPTFDGALFDPHAHTWDEIAQATCQAELVHETSAVLSFLPIAAGIRFGAYPVFIVTSLLAAAFDMLFVVMQRYNRQRILKLLQREKTVK